MTEITSEQIVAEQPYTDSFEELLHDLIETYLPACENLHPVYARRKLAKMMRVGLRHFLLSQPELDALNALAVAAGHLSTVIHADGTDRDIISQDWTEAAQSLHRVQRIAVHNVAARVFPAQFRHLGRPLGPDTDMPPGPG
jgi:hypothetical protein